MALVFYLSQSPTYRVPRPRNPSLWGSGDLSKQRSVFIHTFKSKSNFSSSKGKIQYPIKMATMRRLQVLENQSSQRESPSEVFLFVLFEEKSLRISSLLQTEYDWKSYIWLGLAGYLNKEKLATLSRHLSLNIFSRGLRFSSLCSVSVTMSGLLLFQLVSIGQSWKGLDQGKFGIEVRKNIIHWMSVQHRLTAKVLLTVIDLTVSISLGFSNRWIGERMWSTFAVQMRLTFAKVNAFRAKIK